MLVISARLSNLQEILVPLCNASPIVITKIGSFTKCAYEWLPYVLEQRVKDTVSAYSKDALVYTVESTKDLVLNETELRYCQEELSLAYTERICSRAQEISLPRSAWIETEEDGGDKYAHVSILSIDSEKKMAKIRFLSGPLKGDVADVHLSELPLEWLDDILY